MKENSQVDSIGLESFASDYRKRKKSPRRRKDGRSHRSSMNRVEVDVNVLSNNALRNLAYYN
jgi:hypothetical protein